MRYQDGKCSMTFDEYVEIEDRPLNPEVFVGSCNITENDIDKLLETIEKQFPSETKEKLITFLIIFKEYLARSEDSHTKESIKVIEKYLNKQIEFIEPDEEDESTQEN